MKHRMAALAALAMSTLISAAALAGPNAGGTLILTINTDIDYTTDIETYCDMSTLADCQDAVFETSDDGPLVIHALAAFIAGSSPRLAGVTFGVDYIPGQGLNLGNWGACGDFELPDGAWPDPGAGTAITWSSAQLGLLTDVYWFGAYAYASYGSGSFSLIDHPVQGANFADDDVPSNVDPVEAFGAIGFYGGPSALPCFEDGVFACCFVDGSCSVLPAVDCLGADGEPQADTTCSPNPCLPDFGACCLAGACTFVSPDDCDTAGGVYQGNWVPCDPNPCPPVPTHETTWGRIKSQTH